MDRRVSTRIPFINPAFVMQGDKPFFSETKDVSEHGMFIKTSGVHHQGEQSAVSIYWLESKITISITIPCTVARVSESGIGITSQHLDPELFLSISNLLYAQKNDAPSFMQSFYSCLSDMNSYDYPGSSQQRTLVK
jgi:hypothetical protein